MKIAGCWSDSDIDKEKERKVGLAQARCFVVVGDGHFFLNVMSVYAQDEHEVRNKS